MADIPTPRQIKTFINQVGLMRMLASVEIPTKSIAYYVIYKYINNIKETDALRTDILNKKLPRENDMSFIHENCDMHLAGLVFGVNPKKGHQLLLEPVIENALKTNKGEEIKTLLDQHQDGFWSVFNFHITRLTEMILLLPYSKTIYDSLWGENKGECSFFIKRLDELELKYPNENTIDYYISIIKMLIESEYPVEKQWEQILKSLEIKFNEENFDIPLNINLLSRLANSFGGRELKKYFFNSENLTRWEQWASEAFSKKVNAFKWIIPPYSIIGALSQQIKPGQPISDAIFKLHDYSLKAGIKEWTPFATACVAHLSWNNGNPSGNNHSAEVIKYLLHLLFIDPTVTGYIQKLLKTGRFYNFVHHQQAKQSVLYSAIMTALYYKNELHSFVVPPVGNSETGIKIIRDFWMNKNEVHAHAVWTILSEYKIYTIIWELAENSENKLISDLISIGIKNDPSNLFEAKGNIIDLHNALRIVDDNEIHENITKCFMDYSNILDKLKETEEIDVIVYSKELHFIIDMLEDISGFKNKIIQKLVDISSDDWIQAFNEGSYLLSLVVSVKNKDTKFCLENSYFDGIYDCIKRWLVGNLEPTDWIINHWSSLVNILKRSFQTYFKNKITDLLWNNLDDINIIAFDKNVENFQIAKTINNNIDTLQNYLERSLNTEIVLEKLKLLDRILSNDKRNSFIPEPYFTDVVNKPLNDLFEFVDDEQKEMFIRIADRFKVPLKKDDKLSEEDIET